MIETFIQQEVFEAFCEKLDETLECFRPVTNVGLQFISKKEKEELMYRVAQDSEWPYLF
jgi:hypothetical protein